MKIWALSIFKNSKNQILIKLINKQKMEWACSKNDLGILYSVLTDDSKKHAKRLLFSKLKSTMTINWLWLCATASTIIQKMCLAGHADRSDLRFSHAHTHTRRYNYYGHHVYCIRIIVMMPTWFSLHSTRRLLCSVFFFFYYQV